MKNKNYKGRIYKYKELDFRYKAPRIFIKPILWIQYFAVLSLSIKGIIDFRNLLSEDRADVYLFSALSIIGTMCAIDQIKNGRTKHIESIKDVCSRKKFREIIKNEEFIEINNLGCGGIYESKSWVKIGKSYIPKNYIANFYIKDSAYGRYRMCIITVNGSHFSYGVGEDALFIERSLNKFKKMQPKSELLDKKSISVYTVGKEHREKFMDHIRKEGFVFEDSIKLGYEFK